MTAIPDIQSRLSSGRAVPRTGRGPCYDLEETFWGYIVTDRSRTPVGLILGQLCAWLLGSACLVAAFGLWAVPAGMAGVAPGLRAGATTLLVAMAVLLIWFASRGTRSELQFDTRRGEVREVVRNRAGRPTLLSRYGFDAIGAVFIDRSAGRGRAALVLRWGNTARTLPVVAGPEGELAALRDRIGRDLLTRDAQEVRAPRPLRRAA